MLSAAQNPAMQSILWAPGQQSVAVLQPSLMWLHTFFERISPVSGLTSRDGATPQVPRRFPATKGPPLMGAAFVTAHSKSNMLLARAGRRSTTNGRNACVAVCGQQSA